MRIQTLVRLARSNTPADRSRVHLAVGALAVSGALLMGAFRVARLIGNGDLSKDVYSNYVAETGLRGGLAIIILTFALLIGGVGVQALRIGTAARERRMAALTLAGASQRQVRNLATTDAALVGLAGGLWAGPVYLVLTFAFSGLPVMAQVLLPAEAWDLLVWPVLVGMMTLAGLAMGRLAHRLPVPSGRSLRPGQGMLVIAVVLVIAGIGMLRALGFGGLGTILLGMLVAVLGVTGRLAYRGGRRMIRSGKPVNLLAGVRLVTDSRPAGRIAAMLFCCGILIGGLANGAVTTALDHNQFEPEFFITGMLLTTFGVLLIMIAVQLALVVSAADQLVEQRRQLACLTALGVGPKMLRAVIRRQLGYLASPSLATGLLIGSVCGVLQLSAGPPSPAELATVITAVALPPLGWALGQLGAAAAGFLLRNHIRDAVDPGNLRAA